MRILFVWTGVTSYMADCWRALQRMDGVELKVIVEQTPSGSDFAAAEVLHDLDYTLVTSCIQTSNLPNFQPDVIFAGGWRSRNTRRVLSAFPDVPKVFCLDMPWRPSLRCVLARWVLRPFLRQFRRIYVPGELTARYARWLGFAPDRIDRKLYSIGFGRFEGFERFERRGFLYLGRFAPEKRIDLLVKAFARYRELGGTWPFDLYGSGDAISLPSSLFPLPSFHPFVQPDELPRIYRDHTCLLMASAFDPWPLVILEATAAGLSVIASDRCGNGKELGTRRVPFGDVEAMAQEMLKVEREWAEGGSRPPAGLANSFAKEYDCGAWAKRTMGMARGLEV